MGSSAGWVGQEAPERSTALDFVARLLVPALAVIAVIVEGRDHGALALLLAAVAVISLAVGFGPPLARWARAKAVGMGDQRAAARALPELLRLVARFGGCVDYNRSNLHNVVSSRLCGNNPAAVQKLGLPDAQLIGAFHRALMSGLEGGPASVALFRSGLLGFSGLVGAYNNYCVRNVFQDLARELESSGTGLPKALIAQIDWERMGARLPTEIPEPVKRELNLCREEFYALVGDYERFLRGLGEVFLERQLGSSVATGGFPRYAAL